MRSWAFAVSAPPWTSRDNGRQDMILRRGTSSSGRPTPAQDLSRDFISRSVFFHPRSNPKGFQILADGVGINQLYGQPAPLKLPKHWQALANPGPHLKQLSLTGGQLQEESPWTQHDVLSVHNPLECKTRAATFWFAWTCWTIHVSALQNLWKNNKGLDMTYQQQWNVPKVQTP